MRTFLRRLGSTLCSFVRSIRFRLTLWSVAFLAIILLVFSIFVYTRQVNDLRFDVQSLLASDTRQYEALIRMGIFFDNGDTSRLISSFPGGSLLWQSNVTLAVIAANGATSHQFGGLDASTAEKLLQDWQKNNTGAGSLLVSAPNGAPAEISHYMFMLTPQFVDRRMVGLIVAGRPFDVSGQLPRLALTLLLASLATLGAALAGGYLLAGRAMAPVRTITRAARSISETDLHRRLKLSTKDELGELADTFDGMLERLQAAFDRQRQFTADASHELRTPLTIIGLEADQALERRRTPEEYERMLQVIRSENDLMASLVNDLLTLARMDAGQTRLRMEALDLSDVALDVVERLAPLSNYHQVELDLGDLPPAPVQGDRQYLCQMLGNLVENAIKYAGGPGKHVRIETGRRQNGDGAVAWVRVEDDGPGIAADHLPRLFDRFYRVDAARTRAEDDDGDHGKSPDGSGLGLSIVQWIARAHGGEVSVESQPGCGTAFEVKLPEAK